MSTHQEAVVVVVLVDDELGLDGGNRSESNSVYLVR